ncbi:hypothetical protein SASPL_123070 [Salvia splendens]|uniref:At3g05675-like ankyrin-like domain-containing protein n=1 Tax=Salvia splendens TaxID=180675 RepID=A0A8X8XKF0_SALSN|nr:BTB/POZ domain-containing protein At3g50780-like [Salvia splendens]KAG6415656.1 hypothetical protein SASPL_123070 [Salvia splendens]
MAEIKFPRLEPGQTKIKSVPIAVTPEGFWCCPSPTVFQKTVRTQNPLNKPNPSPPNQTASSQKKQTSVNEKKASCVAPRANVVCDVQTTHGSDAPAANASLASEKAPRSRPESAPRKVTIEFGEPGTSDLKVILLGRQGVAVKLSVHRSVLVEHSSFFASRISGQQLVFQCLEIDNCEDAEIYVETIGLMYCRDLKQRLIKQSVSRVLRILKVGEQLGYTTCIRFCLEYLEAVPWVGQDEEDKVVSLVSRLEGEGIGVKPVLKRVSPEILTPPNDTLSRILELVLKSREDKGRREMKSVVLKLLKENNSLASSSSGPSDLCNETLYSSCRSSLDSLLALFKQAAEPDFLDWGADKREPVVRSISLEADNMLWLLDILADRQAADEFAITWANQQELASLHTRLPTVCRHHVSMISARLFVGIGRGELLPSKETRHLLLKTWLQPLINDYSWLHHGCRSFDRKVVEEGVGRTILTLPLEDQQSILLCWLGSFLKGGDSCPNLQRAFEVWWRRTFIRPYGDSGILGQPENLDSTSYCVDGKD